MTASDLGRAHRVLVCDLVGLRHNKDGRPDFSEVRDHVISTGEAFHLGPYRGQDLAADSIHFFYLPELSREDEFLEEAGEGRYDAVIAAATTVPEDAYFPLGGVRIGAGTGNMRSASWGGPGGIGGEAPLMNTPGFNSRATAQMAFKALLDTVPDLPMAHLHARVMAGDFDTGRHLADYPTAKLEGRRLAVLGYGNIGREVAWLGRAFDMEVSVYARACHRDRIEGEGFAHAQTPQEAARGADVLSIHLGLGRLDEETGRSANVGLIGDQILRALAPGAVIVNFDRGEVVDTDALGRALDAGTIQRVCVDADIFVDDAGTVTGPLAPYRTLATRHEARMLLLPHAAADTDHPSRVAGAKQAVDQIRDAIRHRRITNLKGDLPSGYVDAGQVSPMGVAEISEHSLLAFAQNRGALARLRGLSSEIAAFVSALEAAGDDEARREILRMGAESFLRNTSRQTTLLRSSGLLVAYEK